MPEVGVLNLTIHDNSETAAEGLNHLTDALVSIQSAIGNGLKLSGISGPLNKFASAVGANNKTFASVGTFLNAMKEYQRAFKDAENVKFNAQPIKDLKEAIGDGIKIGSAGTQINKIKEALGGGWDTAQSANIKTVLQDIAEGSKSFQGTNLGTTAKNVSATAKALAEYAQAASMVKTALGDNATKAVGDYASATSEPVKQMKRDVIDYQNVMNELKDVQESTKITFKEPLLPLNLQFHAGKGDLVKAHEEFTKLESQTHNVTDAAQEFNVRLQEIGDTVTSIKANPFEDMYQSLSKLSGELGWFKKEGMRLMAGPDVHRPVLDEHMLSTQVGQLFTKEIYDSWKPNFVMDDSWMNNMYQQMVDMYNEFGWFRNAGPALPAGQSLIGLPAGEPIIGEGTVSEAIEEFREGASAATAFAESIEHVADAADNSQAFDPAIEFARQWNASTGGGRTGGFAQDDVAWVNNLIDNASKVDLLNMKISALTDRLYEGASSGKMTGDQIANMTMQIQSLKDEVDSLSSSAGLMSGIWDGFRNGMKKMFPTITQMLGRFKQIAKYRMLRSVIRHITSGFSEGLQNMYNYSKLVNGSFAPAMDSAATAIAQMKNSLGAALAPAIQAVIPYVNQLVNWFITLVNYVNQFFALLNGQASWTRALPATVNAFDKQKKAAKGASAAMKDLLADWDELNIIQKETSGGGSGTGKTAEDYLKMFEEVNRFDNKIKDITDFIKRNMDDAFTIVKDIGLAILGWKFSNAFTGLLGQLGSLIAIGLTVKLTADVTNFFDRAYVETENGTMLFADGIMAAALAGVAGKLGQVAFGKAAGEITAGITLAVSAGASFAVAEEARRAGKQAQADMLDIVGGIKTALAFALSTKGFLAFGAGLPLSIIGGIATVAITTAISFSLTYSANKAKEEYEMADEAFRKTTKGGLDPAKYIEALQTKFDEITKDSTLVLNAHVEFNELGDKVRAAMNNINELSAVVRNGSLTKEEATVFKDNWKLVLETLDEMNNKSYNTILSGLNSALSKAVGESKGYIEQLRTQFIQAEHNVDEQTAEMFKEMQDIVGRLGANKYKNEEDFQKDIERYSQLAEAIQIMTDTTYDEMNKAIERGKGIDFSETGLEGAKEWINEVSDAAQEARKAKDDALQAYIESFEFENRKIDSLVTAGFYTKEQGDAIKQNYIRQLEVLTDMTDKDKKEIDAKMNEAFAKVLEGAFTGDVSNGTWRQAIVPFLRAIKEAGGEIPQFIVEAIKEGMQGGFYEGGNALSPDYFWSLFRNSGEFGAQRTASEAVDMLNERIKQLVSEGHGETWYLDLIDLFNIDGIDLLSDEWKQSILSYAREAGLDDQFIEDLMKELGLTEDKRVKVQKHIEKAVEETIETPMKQGTWLDDVRDFFAGLSFQAPTVDEPRIEIQKPANDNPMGWLDIFGLSYTPPTEDNVAVPVVVTPEFEVEISDETIDEVRRGIQEALMDDGRMDIYEMDALDSKFGMDLVNKIWAQLEEEGMNPDGTFGKIPAGMRIASTGINYGPNNVPVNYAPSGENNTIVTEPKDPQQEISNTASGVERGNRNLEGLMRDLLAAMNRVGDRPITVSLFPSSGWGNTNRQSEKKMEEVTGYNG